MKNILSPSSIVSLFLSLSFCGLSSAADLAPNRPINLQNCLDAVARLETSGLKDRLVIAPLALYSRYRWIRSDMVEVIVHGPIRGQEQLAVDVLIFTKDLDRRQSVYAALDSALMQRLLPIGVRPPQVFHNPGILSLAIAAPAGVVEATTIILDGLSKAQLAQVVDAIGAVIHDYEVESLSE